MQDEKLIIFLTILGVLIYTGLIILIYYWKEKKNKKAHSQTIYVTEEVTEPIPQRGLYSKKKYLTNTEKKFYQKLLIATNNFNVNVQMQINLACIIDKNDNSYRNELFRNIDFGIFDENYNIILLIELNDSTHFMYDRIERDCKVKEICDNAKIPLVTFWANDTNTVEYIRTRITNDIIEFGKKYGVKVEKRQSKRLSKSV